MLKHFSITELFGDRDISIPFDSNVKILVAENGSGKTTILSAIHNVVSGDFAKLRNLEFQKINVTFVNGSTVEITKDLLENFDSILPNAPVIRELTEQLGPNTYRQLQSIVARHSLAHATQTSSLFRQATRRLGVPAEYLHSMLRKSLTQPKQIEQSELIGISLKATREAISKNVPYPLLYFPTYRRVEEELERLGFGELEVSTTDQLIKFGMNDVRECFEKITAEIKNSSIEWFSRINGEMLTQLVDGINITQEMRQQIENPDALKIVLDRIGENIKQADKDHILELVLNNKLNQSHYDPLIYFLANLIKVYHQQRDNDNAIKEFTSVCNKYLVDKEVVYNESKVSIEVLRRKGAEPISISKLSSGEKQIISLFSKLYLDTSKSTAVFFDEPELSLSIQWQKQLLPHVLDSKRCAFLIATTHSPFIFQNDLDSKTTDLTEYTTFN